MMLSIAGCDAPTHVELDGIRDPVEPQPCKRMVVYDFSGDVVRSMPPSLLRPSHWSKAQWDACTTFTGDRHRPRSHRGKAIRNPGRATIVVTVRRAGIGCVHQLYFGEPETRRVITGGNHRRSNWFSHLALATVADLRPRLSPKSEKQ